MGFKGERVGRFVLDRKVGVVLEGEVWRAREATPAAGAAPPADGAAAATVNGAAAPINAIVRLYYDGEWARVLRASGLPRTAEHVNVARILDGALESIPPFVVQEAMDGATLRDIMLGGAKYMPLSAAIPLAVQLVRGLAAMHKLGYAHLDLRPANILVDERGRVKIAEVCAPDYRRAVLARLGDKQRPLPEDLAQDIRAYMPPETKKGDLGGAAGDMYALGLILYEVLTGARPEGFDIRMPSQKDKRVPKILDELIMGAIERTPRARTQNALALEPHLLEGLSKAGFILDQKTDPNGWVRATPWRSASQAVGEETGKFRAFMAGVTKKKD